MMGGFRARGARPPHDAQETRVTAHAYSPGYYIYIMRGKTCVHTHTLLK